jgi:Transmembrane protein of unknown function (DUF3556)
MGFTEPNFPRVEPEAFLKAPFLERVKTLTLNWVENGYGVPRMVHAIYIVKLVFFYALGGHDQVAAVAASPVHRGQPSDLVRRPGRAQYRMPPSIGLVLPASGPHDPATPMVSSSTVHRIAFW